MICDYVDVQTDRVLDVFTITDTGDVSYDTGQARSMVEATIRRTGSPASAVAELVSWSNGYVLTREHPADTTAAAVSVSFDFNPDQERDDRGRWAPSGDAAAEALTGQANDATAAASALLAGPAHDGIQAAAVTDSLSSHMTADGQLTPERAQLHDQIIRNTLAGVPSTEHPVSYMMGGGPAAGKSSILDNPELGIPGSKDAVVVNADVIKEQLPEYDQMVSNGDRSAAAYVHEESSLVSKEVLGAAVENGQPVLLDGTGDSSYDKLEAKVDRLRANGGSVVAHYVTVDPDVAVERANARGERTGRAVSETVVRGTHAAVAAVLPQAMEKGLFDQVTLWSTNASTPTKIAEATGKEITIHDQAAWDTFKGYAP